MPTVVRTPSEQGRPDARLWRFIGAALTIAASPCFGQSAGVQIPKYMVDVRGESSFSLSKNELSFYGCDARKPDKDYRLSGWEEREDGVRLTYADAGASRQIQLAKLRTIYKGVEVDELSLSQFPGLPQYGRVTFRRPVGDGIGLSFSEWAYCAHYGYEPGILTILHTPSNRDAAERWVTALVSAGLVEPKLGDEPGPMGSVEETSNAFVIDMVAGQELKIIEDLRKQPWLIDYTMSPFPMGPGAELISLPPRTIEYLKNPTKSALSVMERALRIAFPRLAAAEYSISNVKGTSFDVLISAPMQKIWPADPSYKAYWLHTKLRVTFYANGRGAGQFNSHAFIDAREGWLPKWPRANRPPQKQYLQFPLSDEGNGKFKNYDVLRHVQSRLTQVFVKHFDGQIMDG